MTPSEYQQLADFFVDQLGRHHRETRAYVEGSIESLRMEFKEFRQEIRSYVEVSAESLRGEIRLVADGVVTNSRRIDANTLAIEEQGHRIEEQGHRIEEQGHRIDALTHRIGSLETTVSARLVDHDGRLRALEKQR